MPKAKQVKATDAPEPTYKLMARLKDKKIASEEDRAAFRALLRQDRDRWRETANMLRQAQLDFVGRLNSDVISKEFMNHACEELRADLAQPDDGALEKMLIDAAVLAWLRLAIIEREYSAKLHGESITLTLGMWWEKRLALTHKRFEKACVNLARVRKLLRPKVTNQLNVGTINALVSGGADPLNAAAISGLHKGKQMIPVEPH